MHLQMMIFWTILIIYNMLILTPSSQLLSSTFNCILDLFMQCFKLLKLLLPVFKYFSISIEEGYVDAIIDNINKLGSYIVVDDMIAMPHARPGNYVNDFGISITTFKNPIKIGSYNDIKILIIVLDYLYHFH